jgi:quercetin dioxygenase-like cupin family protein
MNVETAVVLAGVLGLMSLAAAQATAPEPMLPDALEWFSPPGNPGLRAMWVVGTEGGAALYALRVRLSAGSRIAPHTHPDTRYSTVLSGTLYVGFGAVEDESAMVAVPTGGVYVAPGGQPHYLWARDGDAVYQESGMGPTATVPVGTGVGDP